MADVSVVLAAVVSFPVMLVLRGRGARVPVIDQYLWESFCYLHHVVPTRPEITLSSLRLQQQTVVLQATASKLTVQDADLSERAIDSAIPQIPFHGFEQSFGLASL